MLLKIKIYMKKILCFIVLIIISLSCSKDEENGPIDFFTVRTDHQFYVDGQEIYWDSAYNPNSFGARYHPSSGVKGSVIVDYYTTYDFGIYTSIEEMANQASQTGETVTLGPPITLYSTGESRTTYSVYLHDNINSPYWKVVDLDDIDNTSSNGITGKWMNLSACSNANGESNYFEFFPSGSGHSFSADCNNSCQGFGIDFYYKWSTSGSTLTIQYNSVGDYCGVSSTTPSPDNLTYSLNGNILTINGIKYTRQ